ncbi:MAG: hypothetical protein OES57_12710, partial [Acidimicrobiia bacterium]|nr:hypothetical protein [Acidimicrobiia bacterium]
GSATVDVEVGPSRAALGARNMAPGDVATGGIELRNTGSLPLRYAVTAEITEDPLIEWLRWDIWAQPGVCAIEPPPTVLRRDVVLAAPLAAVLGDPATGTDADDRVLAPTERESLCFAARLPIDAPNLVQGREITLDFVIDAEHDIEPEPEPEGELRLET